MRKILGLCLSAVTVVASMAPAHAGWRKLDMDAAGNTYYFDAQRVVRMNGDVQYWYKVVQPYADHNGVKSYSSKMQGNCYSRGVRPLEGKFYDARGKSIGHEVYDGVNFAEGSTRYAMSGTYDETFLVASCSL